MSGFQNTDKAATGYPPVAWALDALLRTRSV